MEDRIGSHSDTPFERDITNRTGSLQPGCVVHAARPGQKPHHRGLLPRPEVALIIEIFLEYACERLNARFAGEGHTYNCTVEDYSRSARVSEVVSTSSEAKFDEVDTSENSGVSRSWNR